MKNLDKGQDKVEKICQEIRKETLEPAQKEAERIIEEAKQAAEKIVEDAHHEKEKILKSAKAEIAQEKNIFESSLEQASRQSLESLRQSIEHKMFNEGLDHVLKSHTSNPQVVATLINAIVKALEKEGLDAHLSAIIPKEVSSKDVVVFLAEDVKSKLKDEAMTVGNFAGGAQVKLMDKKMTVDISDKALSELVSSYVRKDFRKLFFNA